jgi:hypothetical protein
MKPITRKLSAQFLLPFYFLLLTSGMVCAQNIPQRFSYQAVIRDGANQVLTNQSVGIRLSILQGSESGTAVYAETHIGSTNANGLISLQVGGGSVVIGSMSSIDWAAGPYYIKTETDPEGGTNYSITGSSQLLSVPYALYSANGTPGPAGPTGPQGPAGPSGSGGFVHYPGEAFGGGVVFHVYKDGSGAEHGLIVALTNQSDAQAWSNVTDQLAGASSSWNGLSNSNAIVAQAGHTNSAAKLCLDYEAGGFNDWYLPAKYEINLLWGNLYNDNKTITSITGATEISLSNSGDYFYWSSSENYSSNAWVLNTNGYVDYYSKGNALQVRAVRAF